MYEEGIREYRDAKRKAGKPFGTEKSLSLGSHLPSNAEIHHELTLLIDLYEEKVHPERLLRMRVLALKYMEFFNEFNPYLVGSVLSGAVTGLSDIDLHLFADSPDEVETLLNQNGMAFETETVCIRKGNEFKDFIHIYLEDEGVAIECSIYPREERHLVGKSSITGKKMARAGLKKLRLLIAEMVG